MNAYIAKRKAMSGSCGICGNNPRYTDCELILCVRTTKNPIYETERRIKLCSTCADAVKSGYVGINSFWQHVAPENGISFAEPVPKVGAS